MKPSAKIEDTGLYLVLELGSQSGAAGLAAILDAAAWQSTLIRSKPDATLDQALATTVATELQTRGIAALVADNANLAKTLNADGLHITQGKHMGSRYVAARAALGRSMIVGGDAGRSRHDAMELGEAGADYIAFGIPAHVEDRATARERQLDLIAWWSEVFEPPCVAFDVETPEHAEALARAGADFIAVTLKLDDGVENNIALVKAFTTAISSSRVTA